jgi:hypothetical protein
MTHLSILAAGLGFFVFFQSTNKSLSIFAVVVALVGLIWRFEGAILGLFIAALFILQTLYFHKALIDKNALYKKISVILSTIFIVATVNFLAYDKFSPLLSPAEREFSQFNQARGEFHAWVPYFVDKKVENRIRKKVGWSPNDLKLIRHFYFADKNLYSYDTLKSFNNYVSDEKSYHKDIQNIIWLFNIFKPYILFFILFNFLLFFINIRFTTLLITFFNLTIPILALYATLFVGSIPERVFYPTLLLASIFSALVFFTYHKKTSTNLFYKKINKNFYTISFSIILVTLSSALILNAKIVVDSQQSLMLENQDYQNVVCTEDLEKLLEFNYEKPIVAFSGFYTPIQTCTLPFDDYLKDKYFWNNLVPLGWTVNSPSYIEHRDKLELSSDLFTSVAQGEAYLAVGDIFQLQMASEYLREHHGIGVIWPQLPDAYSRSFQVWRAIGAEKINSDSN